MIYKFAFISTMLISFVVPSFAHEVIAITDGGTLILLVNKKPLKIRLANIDAPEKKQPLGQRSKQALSDVCWGKNAEYQSQSIDRYGRTVAVVVCDGVEANRKQVEQGMAWVYVKYNRDETLVEMERTARFREEGLWADPHAMPPWSWRKLKER